MGFFGAMGKAMKAPLKPINKAVGAIPGMKTAAKAMPGASKLGIGPTPNPSGGMGGKFAAMGQAAGGIGNMMGRKSPPPMMPPPQMEQQQAPPPDMQPFGQPQPFLPQEPQMSQPEPMMQPPPDMGGQMPIPQAPQMQQPMQPKRSMFMDRMRPQNRRMM
jgi:hypothetical protein